ncbi:MAG: CBS domain-containing protein [Candidatus Omnitrophica bacterium]|nr:CBS domain-containing protein [Candidatus Omnitrophota bacterium]
MDLITTHINADFDALGSLVAAKKLYPNSRLLLPGSQEDAVREFLSLAREEVAVETEKECRLDDITRLILVDTRQKSRIGIASELVDKGVEIHVYDHHPRMKGDIIADQDIYEEVGATVTILADIIRKKKASLSHVEATVMLQGIYEETGSLTYRSTTKLDVDMVSFLLSRGASLAVVSSYLNRELSEGELSLLTRLIASTKHIAIKGVSVSFIELDSTAYTGELGILLHKLMEIENIPVLFMLIKKPGGKIDIIARSSMASIDVNRVLSRFGGGGHPGAASAKVEEGDAVTVKKRLIGILKETIKSTIYAADIMTRDFRSVSADDTVKKVKKVLLAEKLGGMAVIDRGRLTGIITLVGLNKALKRGYGHSRIKGYMSRDVITVSPKTPLYAIHKIISKKDAGVIPVVEDGKIAGVISRTDVLRSVHDSLFLKPRKVRKDVMLNLAKKMKSVLPGDIIALMRKIGHIANSMGYTAFVVGGLARDLVLGVKNLDLDIVTEGDAIKLGHLLAADLKAAIVVHKKFGTCSVVMKNKLKIDIATARKEKYISPAALPTVEFSSLKDDLVRRDFTINAMAISINASSFGRLIDFFNGRRDLAHGRIKVLHDDSFIDDPTRIFRAVRFESRFGFVIDHHTGELIRNAIDKSMFDRVEPQRIRDELVLILQEKEPLRALRRMAELEELRFIHPAIRFDSDLVRLCGAIDETCAWYNRWPHRKRAVERWLMYLMALFDSLTYAQVSAISNRFVFRGSDRIRLLSYKKHAIAVTKALSAEKAPKPSRIYRMLEPLPFEVTLLIIARTALMDSPRCAARVRSRTKEFLEAYNGARVHVHGDDLKSMGLKPGPYYAVILKDILYNKIDGKLRTKKEEMEYARALARRERLSSLRGPKARSNLKTRLIPPLSVNRGRGRNDKER